MAAEALAQWEPGTFLENPVARPDGSWLVTIPSHNRVDVVQPDGRRDVLARLARHVTGIVANNMGAYILVGSMHQHDGNSRMWMMVGPT